MSLRTQSLFEEIRDVTVQADDRATRDALGRDVLQALREIDRATQAMTREPGKNGSADAATGMQLAMSLASQSTILLGAVAGLTDIRARADAANLVGAGISIRVTGRQRRQI